MLAAVYGLDGPAAVRRRLLALANAARASVEALWVDGSRGMMTCPGAPKAALDEAKRVGWLGDLEVTSDGGELCDARAVAAKRGAFSLVGAHADGLLLARGRFGGRSLYYTREGAAVVACSALAPLVATASRGTGFNDAFLASMVARIPFDDASATAYPGIARLRAAEILLVRRDRCDVMSMDPLADGAPIDGDAREVATELRVLIERAVARATRDTRRVAVLAGGGTDSSGLLAVALAQARGATKREVDAIALDFGGPGDDRPYMRALSEALGIVPLHVRAPECTAHFSASFVVDAAPIAGPTFAWSVSAMKLARARGAEIVLSGFGGDELFDGDTDVFAARACAGDLSGALRDVISLRGAYWLPTWRHRVEHLVARPLLQRSLPGAWLRAARRARTALAPNYPAWYGPQLRTTFRAQLQREPVLPLNGQVRAMATAHYLVDIADNLARVEGVADCAGASPYLDEDLVSFVSRIPPEMFFHGGICRGLFRAAMRGVLPDVVRLRETKWFPEHALVDIFRAAGGIRALRGVVAMRGLEARGLVDPKAFASHLEEVERDPHGGRTWLELWPALAAETLVSGLTTDAAVPLDAIKVAS